MTNKEFIAKLSNLQKTAPDAAWLKSNRELLLTQVSNSGADNLSVWKTLLINLSSLAKASVQPAYALGVFVLVLVGGSVFGNQVFSQVKPNDSLYIARIISEKAKLNTIFDTVERDKLAAQFATQHAQEISAVLADPKFNTDQNQAQVAALSASFNQEIINAKSRLVEEKKTTVDGDVAIADSAKNNRGLQVFVPGQAPDSITGTSTAPAAKEGSEGIKDDKLTATSTATTTIEILEKTESGSDILDEAQKLFDQKEYDQASNKLKEADGVIK